MKDINQAAAEKVIKDRKVAEIEMARELWKLYDETPDLINTLRELVKIGGTYLDTIWPKVATTEQIMEPAVVDRQTGQVTKEALTVLPMTYFHNKELKVLEVFGNDAGVLANNAQTALANFKSHIDKLDPAKPNDAGTKWWDMGRIGSFFRGFGAACEVLHGHLDGDPETDAAVKGFNALNEARQSWRNFTSDAFNKAYRSRRNRTQDERNGDGKLPQFLIDELIFFTPTRAAKPAASVVTGITLFELAGQSAIKKYCAMLGLPIGADISGTTTDSIFGIYWIISQGENKAKYMDLIDKVDKNMPLLLLTPMIQMVAQYHHSVADCACALSLNDIIDFKAGVYESLLPIDIDKMFEKNKDGSHGKELPLLNIATDQYWHPNGSHADAVYKILAKYTKALGLQLIYGDQHGPHGGYAMDANDWLEWKYIARMGRFQKWDPITKKHMVDQNDQPVPDLERDYMRFNRARDGVAWLYPNLLDTPNGCYSKEQIDAIWSAARVYALASPFAIDKGKKQ